MAAAQPLVEVVPNKRGSGTHQVVRGYVTDPTTGATMVPTSKAASEIGAGGRDDSGLTLSGFDPLTPLPVVVDPDSSSRRIEYPPGYAPQPGVVTGEATLSQSFNHLAGADVVPKANTRPVETRPTPMPMAGGTAPVAPAPASQAEPVAAPRTKIVFHYGTLAVPAYYHSVIFNDQSQLLVLVTDTLFLGMDPPELQPSTEEALLISIDGWEQPLLCKYFGWRFRLLDRYEIRCLMVQFPEE